MCGPRGATATFGPQKILPELGRHFAGCFAIPATAGTTAACIADADGLIADRVEQLARLWAAARGGVAS